MKSGSVESFFPEPKESEGKKRSVWERAKNSPLLKAGMVAAVIHAVAFESPAIARQAKAVIHAVSGERLKQFEKMWNAPDAVVHVQTPDEQKNISHAVAEREARKNPNGLKAFKQAARERMEHGEPVSYQELYFEQAQLNGVPEADVQEAWKMSDELIAYYAGKIHQGGESFDETFIKSTSQELYDRAKPEWGSGSVVDYFKKDHPTRNCVAIAQAERIVFEGIINRLPETERWKFTVGKRVEKQHELAVLRISEQRNAPSAATFIVLQPPFAVERGESPVGTATIDGALLKQALVSEKPIKVQAQAPKAGEVAVNEGPDIDVVTNQPVDDGIVIEGPLRGSDFVRQQALEEDRVIEKQSEQTVELEVIEDGFHPTQTARSEHGSMRLHVDVNAFSLRPLTIQDIDSIKTSDPNQSIERVRFGSPVKWTEATVFEALRYMVPSREISFEIDPTQGLSKSFFDGLTRSLADENGRMSGEAWETIHFRDPDESELPISETSLPIDDLRRVVNILDGKGKSIRIDTGFLSPDEARVITGKTLKGIYLTRQIIYADFDPNVGVDALTNIILKKSKVPIYYKPRFAGSPVMGEESLNDDDKLYPDLASLDVTGLTDVVNMNKNVKTKKAALVWEFCRRFRETTDDTLSDDLANIVHDDWIRATTMPIDDAWKEFVQREKSS